MRQTYIFLKMECSEGSGRAACSDTYAAISQQPKQSMWVILWDKNIWFFHSHSGVILCVLATSDIEIGNTDLFLFHRHLYSKLLCHLLSVKSINYSMHFWLYLFKYSKALYPASSGFSQQIISFLFNWGMEKVGDMNYQSQEQGSSKSDILALWLIIMCSYQ